MRRNYGDLALLHRPGPSDHACLIYDNRREFITAAVEFLRAGVLFNQRLVYIAEGDPATLLGEISALEDIEMLVANGGLVLCPLVSFCDPMVGVVLDNQLILCQQLLRAALDDGFAGIRFAGDVTRLASPPLSWENHLRWEQLADATMDGEPIAALCGYQASVIDSLAAAALSSAHPIRGAGESPFGLFWRDGALSLDGELDTHALPTLCACLEVDATTADVVIDSSTLDFVDGACCAEFARVGRSLRAKDLRLVLRGGPPLLLRLQAMLGFEGDFAVEAD